MTDTSIHEETVRLAPVIEAADELLREKGQIVIALDGMAASGKTTAGEILARRFDAPVVHMDDFFLPPSLRTPERLAEPGGNVDYMRFRREVLPGLTAGKPFGYRRFSCDTMAYIGRKNIPAAAVTVVEGAYALHPSFGHYGDICVYFQISSAEQERRIRSRNGTAGWEVFRSRWIPMENRYAQAFQIPAQADMVL